MRHCTILTFSLFWDMGQKYGDTRSSRPPPRYWATELKLRFYLGVNAFTPVSATSLEFDWRDVKSHRWLAMLRYLNRIKDMTPDRWPRKIFNWDISLRAEGWSDQVKAILSYINIECDMKDEEHVDLDVCHSRLKRLNRQRWLLEATTKLKLRTFLEINDESNPRALIKCNLPQHIWCGSYTMV